MLVLWFGKENRKKDKHLDRIVAKYDIVLTERLLEIRRKYDKKSNCKNTNDNNNFNEYFNYSWMFQYT